MGLRNDDQRLRLLGFYSYGPPPIGSVAYAFKPGLTVLYGKNGAGKSRLLGELDGLLRGEHEFHVERDAALHLAVDPALTVEREQDVDVWDTPDLWLSRSVLPGLADQGTWGEIAAAQGGYGDVHDDDGGALLIAGANRSAGLEGPGWGLMHAIDHMQVFEASTSYRGLLPGDVVDYIVSGGDHPIGWVRQADGPAQVLSFDRLPDPHELMMNRLVPGHERDGGLAIDDQHLDLIAGVQDHIASLSAVVSAPYRQYRFNLKGPERWILGDLPRWEARTPLGWVDLDDLSLAEGRWARAMITLGMQTHSAHGHPWEWRSRRPLVLLIDEPELGLHREAEFGLASTLADLCRFVEQDLEIIVASHSPFFLGQPEARQLHVTRDGDGRTVLVDEQPLLLGGPPTRDSADKFGLVSSDFWNLTRAWVFVEGVHDRDVLSAFLGPALRHAGARIVVIGGAKKLGEAAGPIYTEMSDAPALIVLDKLGGEAVGELWHQAQEAAAADDDERTRQLLQEIKRTKGYEAQGLADLGFAALEHGVPLSRYRAAFLSLEDIILYLPVASFVPAADSWEQVLANRPKDKNVKRHIVDAWRQHRPISDDEVRDAAWDAPKGTLHPDLVDLMGSILDLGSNDPSTNPTRD